MEEFKISIESEDYTTNKTFKLVVGMDTEQFLELVQAVHNHLKENKIENYKKPGNK